MKHLALVAAAGTLAHADPATRTETYGGEIVIVDAASTAVTTGAFLVLADDNLPISLRAVAGITGAFGINAYLALAPWRHRTHDQRGRALESLGLRVALPITGAIVVGSIGSNEGRNSAIGALGGIVVASGFDALVLARRVVVVPYVAPTGVGIVATF